MRLPLPALGAYAQQLQAQFVHKIPAGVQPIYTSYDDTAPSSVWVEVAAVFSAAFSVAPYFENPDELALIVDWGPSHIARAGGRLTTACSEGKVVGFALVHGLAGDDSWEGTLSSMAATNIHIEWMGLNPQKVVVVHELAVDAGHRGQGIAQSCLALALRSRAETDVVLGVYEQAHDARVMYARWGFEDFGGTLIQEGTVRLRVLAAGLADLRIAPKSS